MAATGVAEIESLDGNRGVVLMLRLVDSAADFTFVSLWSDIDSIKTFAGANPERAVVDVEHHDVVGGHAAGDRFGAPNIPEHGAAQADDTG